MPNPGYKPWKKCARHGKHLRKCTYSAHVVPLYNGNLQPRWTPCRTSASDTLPGAPCCCPPHLRQALSLSCARPRPRVLHSADYRPKRTGLVVLTRYQMTKETCKVRPRLKSSKRGPGYEEKKSSNFRVAREFQVASLIDYKTATKTR